MCLQIILISSFGTSEFNVPGVQTACKYEQLLSRQRNAAKYTSADITRTKYERYSLFADLHDDIFKI